METRDYGGDEKEEAKDEEGELVVELERFG